LGIHAQAAVRQTHRRTPRAGDNAHLNTYPEKSNDDSSAFLEFRSQVARFLSN